MFQRRLLWIPVLVLVPALGCSDLRSDEERAEDAATTSGTASTSSSTSETTAGEGIPIDEWVEQADDVCAEATTQLDELGEPQSADEAVELFDQVVDISTVEAERMAAIPLPAEDTETVVDLVELVEQRVELLTEVNEQLQSGADPQQTFDDSRVEQERLNDEARALTRELDMQVCGSSDDDGSSSTTGAPPTTSRGVEVPETGEPVLDAMLQACSEGNGVACDQAFAVSEEGSEAEAYGDTCGDTEEAGTICASVYGGTKVEPELSDGDEYGDDPTLDGYYDSCEAGEMSQCDLLYLTSPIGSEYEEFGGTCGGTFSTDDAPFSCVTGE